MVHCKIPLFLMEQILSFDLSSSVRMFKKELYDFWPPVN